MNCTDKAWLGGIVDGEGCIDMYSRNNHSSKYYIIRIVIANTNKNAMDFIQNNYKKYCHRYIQIPKSKKAKECHIIQFSTQNAIRLLKDIKPYLKIKKKQANICIKMNKSIIKNNRKKLSPKVVHYRKELYAELKKLNKRGV